MVPTKLERKSNARKVPTFEQESDVKKVEEVFLKTQGTGLFRRNLQRRKKALKEVKGFKSGCRDKEIVLTDLKK